MLAGTTTNERSKNSSVVESPSALSTEKVSIIKLKKELGIAANNGSNKSTLPIISLLIEFWIYLEQNTKH